MTLVADPPPLAHAAEVGNGPAEVTLAVCATGDTQTDSFIPDCSYTYLTKVAAPSYTYITSQGAVAWKGTAAGGALSFPASGQTWPTLTNLFLGASRTTTPKDITGTIDANGKVDLILSYDTLLKTGANECTLTGTVQLSSQGTEKLGGQAVGKDYDPATGQFAVVSTSYTAPAATGSCLLVNAAYDLSKGMGWYLTGTMTLPAPPVPPVVQKQTATVKVPKKVKRKGKTVLLKKAVVTNAGQKARREGDLVDEEGRQGDQGQVRDGEDHQGRQGDAEDQGQGQEVVREVVAEGPGDDRVRGVLVHQEVDGQVGPVRVQEPPLQPRRAA